MTGPCCSPTHDDARSGALDGPNRGTAAPAPARTDWVRLDGDTFDMGSPGDRYPGDGEAPIRRVTVDAFSIAANAVSNDDWARFVDATGHLSTAEQYGSSFVFGGLLPDDFPPTQGVVGAPWWRLVDGACWRHPEGPGSDLDGRGGHPVVHVSWIDASEYCRWSETSLPTEPQWEFAARGGLEQAVFPWGDELCPGGEHRMNVFQGTFPSENTGADGYVGTAPTDEYEPNGYGLHNVCGNVWEWCADRFDPGDERRSMRGGSYLCHESYCERYRVAARSSNTPDSSSGNIGFRVVTSRSPMTISCSGEPERTARHDVARPRPTQLP